MKKNKNFSDLCIGLIIVGILAILLCVWFMDKLNSGSDEASLLDDKVSLICEYYNCSRENIISYYGGYNTDSGLYEYSFTWSGESVVEITYSQPEDLTINTVKLLHVQRLSS